MRSLATNQQVADDLEVDVSTASRLRSGYRRPSINMMSKIQQVYGWLVGDQARSMLDNTFDKSFEGVLCDKYGSSKE